MKRFLTQNRLAVRLGSIALAGVSALAVSVGAVGLTVGVRVLYKGSELATVKSSQSYTAAVDLANRAVGGGSVGVLKLSEPDFQPVLTVESQITDEESLANLLVEKAENVVSATELWINGELAARVAGFDVERYLESRLSSYHAADSQSESVFVEAVETKQGHFLSESLDHPRKAFAAANALTVKTTVTVAHEAAIPFSTVTEQTDAQVVGYTEVKTEGINGVSRVTEQVILLNGVETERIEIANEVLSAPVNRVVLEGTAKSISTPAQRQAASDQGFVFPIPPTKYMVSAYYGDGRNHKGVDLATDSGTPIYAVKDGVVTYSGWDGAYGYSVIVDHGNGMMTRYAHASRLLVSTGVSVNAGDTLALVGQTGMATGNHLHFEVIINGVQYDPAPYIGLG